MTSEANVPDQPCAPLVRPTVTFESLTFSDGTTIHLEPNDVVVFVGPNNAGKSAALREIEQLIGPNKKQLVITSGQIRKIGTAEQLNAFLDKEFQKRGDTANPSYLGFRFSHRASNVSAYWNGNLEPLRPFFCMRILTETRITDSNDVEAIAILTENPSHPIHLLYSNDEIEKRISDYFRRAFIANERPPQSQLFIATHSRCSTTTRYRAYAKVSVSGSSPLANWKDSVNQSAAMDLSGFKN